MFAAGAGHIGDYSHCSWSVDRHRAVPAARRRVAGDRQRRNRRAGGRGPGRGHRARAAARPRCWRRCAPRTRTRNPRSTSSRWRRCPASAGLGRIGDAGRPGTVAAFVSRVGDGAAARRRGGCARRATPTRRCRGSRCAAAPATRCSARRGRRRRADAYVTADLRHHPADEHRRASDVALIDVAHWASEYPVVRTGRRAAADPFRRRAAGAGVSPIRTDPWNIEKNTKSHES